MSEPIEKFTIRHGRNVVSFMKNTYNSRHYVCRTDGIRFNVNCTRYFNEGMVYVMEMYEHQKKVNGCQERKKRVLSKDIKDEFGKMKIVVRYEDNTILMRHEDGTFINIKKYCLANPKHVVDMYKKQLKKNLVTNKNESYEV